MWKKRNSNDTCQPFIALNTQDEENAGSLLISSDTDMENEPLNVDSSIDESHLLNFEEQHNNNKGHVTSD